MLFSLMVSRIIANFGQVEDFLFSATAVKCTLRAVEKENQEFSFKRNWDAMCDSIVLCDMSQSCGMSMSQSRFQ